MPARWWRPGAPVAVPCYLPVQPRTLPSSLLSCPTHSSPLTPHTLRLQAINELMKPREEKDADGEGKMGRTGDAAAGTGTGTGTGGGLGGTGRGGLLPGQVKDVEDALVEAAKEVR